MQVPPTPRVHAGGDGNVPGALVLKLTLPVGAPPVPGATVTVQVLLVPTGTGLGAQPRVVPLVAAWTTSGVVPLLEACVASPP